MPIPALDASTVNPASTPHRGASQISGLGDLVRFVLRRERVRILLWAGTIVALVNVTGASISGLYDTQFERDQYGQLAHDNAAIIVQAGPGYGLGTPTIGAIMMNELAVWVIISVALMNVFMIVRHTRAQEETEQAELIRAGPIGRHAPIAAALIGALIENSLVAIGVVCSLLLYGLPALGSLAFGAALTASGMTFAAITAIAAQVASSARSARALASTSVAMAFVLRAIGDIGDGRLSWLSPIGWAQAIRAYADERWWVLVLPIVATSAFTMTAVRLEARRDFGAGLLQQRPGRAVATKRLTNPFGLAVRLQRGSVIGWSVGLGLLGFFYGIVADQAESLIENNPDMADFFAQLGEASMTDAFLSTSALIMALMACGFTISSILRLHSEESATHADSILASPIRRRTWVASHLAVATGGTALVMSIVGVSTGIGLATMTGDLGEIPRLLGAALVMTPAMMVVGGVTLVLYGAVPKWSQLSWSALVFVFVVGTFGKVLKLPQWVLDMSPFQHVPPLPAAPFQLVPLVVLGVIAVILMAAGVAVFDRRDIV